MRRPLLLALCGVMSAASPALAWDFGKPYGNISMDLGYDDHVTGHEVPDPTTYARGNIDGASTLGLGLSGTLNVDADQVLTVTGNLKGYRYVTYPEFSRAWGSMAAEYATYHLPGAFDAFWNLNLGSDLTADRSLGGTLTLEHPAWGGLVGGASLGGYRFLGDTTVDHTGWWGELSLRRAFGPLSVTAAYSAIHRGYDAGIVDQVQSASLYASWRFMSALFLRLSAEHDWTDSTDSTRRYAGNLVNLGTLCYAF